jgi:feruloyl esterase
MLPLLPLPGFAADCAAVTTASLNLPSVTITAAAVSEPDKGLPRHCLVTGKVNERTGLDGKAYAIQFEMRLPDDWNGRFLHQVNGGNDGVVVPAYGDRVDAPSTGGTPPLARGFAVLSSDSGHQGKDPANAALGLAGGAAFGLDPQARRDYGYSADITLSPVAKAIIALYYGRKPVYSYMYGCSNGGRHTMVAASRMPEAYDGFLAGNPGFDLPKAAVQHAWDVQHLLKLDPDIRKSITTDDARMMSTRVIEACDGLDGLKDGLVSNLKACQKTFDFASLACKAGEADTCLPQVKVDALKAMFAGPVNSKGEALYSDWPVDGGIGLGNWRLWKVESQIPPFNNHSLIATMGAASLSYIFTTPPTQTGGGTDQLIAFLTAFDFDKDAPKIFAKDATFPESAMDFMTPPDVAHPMLDGLRNAGHKLIVFHGQADPVFSLDDTIHWYDRLDADTGGEAAGFARLFALPGVTHCGGGPGLDKFDALGALVDWVEKGKAPDRIIATVNPANKDVPADWSRTRSRPLCPWPSFARYGGGDAENAASFACARE